MKLWLARHLPVLMFRSTRDRLSFRATWHCPECEDWHDRNQYGHGF